MTLDKFYENLAVPDACLLGKRIFKKQFYENGQLNTADKKAFVEDIDNIEWRYILKPSTIHIPRFEDEIREYLELEILEVTLNAPGRYERIAATMQKAIPYPLLIVFSCNSEIALSTAEKRINRADTNKLVIETLYGTGWISLQKPEPWQTAFVDDFGVPRFSYRNFLEFHQDMVKRIVALNCAVHTGRYTLYAEQGNLPTDRLERLKREQTELCNVLKKEKNLGKQVLLNTQVRQLSQQIEEIKNEI